MPTKNEAREVCRLFSSLVKSNLHRFSKLRCQLNAPRSHGVYVIYNPKKTVLHVGRSIRGKQGLLQRIKEHLNNQSSFSTVYLRSMGRTLRKGYMYRYLPLASPRKRALLESLAIGLLCPKHLGLGLKKSK